MIISVCWASNKMQLLPHFLKYIYSANFFFVLDPPFFKFFYLKHITHNRQISVVFVDSILTFISY